MEFALRIFNCLGLLLCGALVFVGEPNGKANANSSAAFAIALADGTIAELDFSSDPELSDCRPVDSTENRQLWRSSTCSLELTLRREQGADLVKFTLGSLTGNPIRLYQYCARIAVPYSTGDALWSYNRLPTQSIMETDLAKPSEFFSAANVGIPLAVLVDGRGLTRLATGLLSQDNFVTLRGELNQEQKSYSLTVRQADDAAGELFEDTFYISREPNLWFQNAQTYTAIVDRNRNCPPSAIPAPAYNPTYDSWYWTMDRIHQGLVWDLAVRTQALGFKTYLLDAGWDTPAGQYFQWLDGSTGDYSPPPDAFPDFLGLLDGIQHRLGMKVMLWMQQYALGRRSIYYPELGGALSCVVDEATGGLVETAALCPRVDTTRRHMIDLFRRVLDEYRPDAFWFDWQEDIPVHCAAPHFHDYPRFGDGYNTTQQAILGIIRQRAPEVFIDMRWPFANLNNKPYTHLWQPIDSPDDFEAMRLRAMIMRPFSAGIIMGTDEMYWSPMISNAEAARFMGAVVFTGVPYFGPNLLAEPASRAQMLKAWLNFYEGNKEDLVNGAFAPYGDRDRPDQLIEGQRATFIYYGNRYKGAVRLTKANRRLYLFNASSSPGIDLIVNGLRPGDYLTEISDLTLKNAKSPFTVSLKRNARLQFPVPVGCLLTLTRTP